MAAPRRSGSSAKPSAIPTLEWREPRPAPIVLVFGSEEVCAERAIAGVRTQLKDEDPSLEVTDIRADDYAPGTLLAVTSPSLFGEPRLVRVSGVEKCNDAFLTEALAYLEAPQDGATVILRHTAASVRGKKLLDAIRSGLGGGVEVPCPAIKKDGERANFAAGEFRHARRKIDRQALEAVTRAFAGDLAELAAACQQLIQDTTGTIDLATVERYYGGRVEMSGFAVADMAIAGDHGGALVALRQALDSGADPVPLVAAFAMKLRTMARVAGKRGPARQVARDLGMPDWQVERAQRDLVGWTGSTLGLAIQATARADAEVKGASRDPVFAVERMVTVVATRAPFGA
ncbi:DNA polymerase III subunit delta [Microbacterium sorbitolivorans]|uniref:DNA-directed DNA polymerase n=1 Tax=Microbacterium sorbitolivorans TaxID=1867410 RepID=A0A367Y775_9MICO|nr:DNA polymerase III subunit delta [Microbacterium sorbitolivorans]RCK61716.1 DNA polymerase III subunit delta [Microbacterium sorbitolivorans]GGF29773.1 DNA polymerase III subunit delta [Microbacterium sorbitolivorans]